MKSLKLAALSCAAFSLIALTGCVTTNPTTGEVITVTNVQSAARAACAFLPTAETVAAIIKTNDPKLATASAVAEAICGAINPKPTNAIAALYRPAPSVNGVIIKGRPI